MEKKPLFAIIFNTDNIHESDREYIIDELRYITAEYDHSDVEVEYMNSQEIDPLPATAAVFIGVNLTSEKLEEKYNKVISSKYNDWWA